MPDSSNHISWIPSVSRNDTVVERENTYNTLTMSPILCFLLSSSVLAQFSPTLWASYVPLAVRSPYLNAWMNTSDAPTAARRAPQLWPTFWNGQTLGWAGHIRVDGSTWKWMGDAIGDGPLNNSLLTNIQITPTRTIMNITAGPVDLTVTWLSPIEPADPVKQSAPFTYVTLVARSNDGQPHAVQVYSDISGEWLSGNLNDVMSWNSQRVGNSIFFHELFLATPLAFSERSQFAADSKVYFAMLLRDDMTWSVDAHTTAREQFSATGVLGNAESFNGSKPIVINGIYNVFAISVDMGTVNSTTSKPVTWGVGLLRETPIAYTTASNVVQDRDAYWKSQYETPQEAVTSLLQDHHAAAGRAEAFEAALLQGITNVSSNSSNYADLVALSARQAMAGTELTIGRNDDGSYNPLDVKMFMKDVGSSNRVNPVELMYTAFPFFLAINASYGGWLIDPILEFALSPRWTYNYAPLDIGTAYPKATGNTADHSLGIEQTGNMLIMLLTHAKISGDGSYISRYYHLLKTWADYLVENTSPPPGNQGSTDDGTGDYPNLAMKGIIGINAMAEISVAVSNLPDSQHFADTAKRYFNVWKSLAVKSGHIVSNFDDQEGSTWALPYDLFAHQMLGMNLVDNETFSQEIGFMREIVSSYNSSPLPVRSDVNRSENAAWTMFTASIMTDGPDDSVRDEMIRQIWAYASRNSSLPAFSSVSTYNALGPTQNIVATPGVGGLFAPLALTLGSKNITNFVAALDLPSHPLPKSTIVGVVVGLLGLILLAGLGVFLWRRKRVHRRPAVRHHAPADDTEIGPIIVCTVPHPFDYLQDTPPVPEKTRREMALGAAREGDRSRSLISRPAAGRTGRASNVGPRNVDDGSDRPVSPEVQRLRYDLDSLRRIVVQAFQPNDRTEPPPEYNEEPRR